MIKIDKKIALSLAIATGLSTYMFGACTAELDMGTKRIINVGTPTSNSDAATKEYVDDSISSGGTTTLPGITTYVGTQTWYAPIINHTDRRRVCGGMFHAADDSTSCNDPYALYSLADFSADERAAICPTGYALPEEADMAKLDSMFTNYDTPLVLNASLSETNSSKYLHHIYYNFAPASRYLDLGDSYSDINSTNNEQIPYMGYFRPDDTDSGVGNVLIWSATPDGTTKFEGRYYVHAALTGVVDKKLLTITKPFKYKRGSYNTNSLGRILCVKQ
jgi:hypothetical protein